jgi:hypothetical protein
MLIKLSQDTVFSKAGQPKSLKIALVALLQQMNLLIRMAETEGRKMVTTALLQNFRA